MLPIDHLVYATPDLPATVAEVARLTGVAPAEGGRHPGWGTRNYLLSLGERVYLEIVGPDEEQATPHGGRIFGVEHLQGPRLVRWAAAASGLTDLARSAAQDGQVDLGPVLAGERNRPDGTTLRWQLTDPGHDPCDGLVPFFIDWFDTPHPAGSSPSGATLVGLKAFHPDPERVRALLRSIPLPALSGLSIQTAEAPSLQAVLQTPRGEVTLT